MHSWQKNLLTIVLWALITTTAFAVFFPALHGGFYFDDIPNIVENNAIHIDNLSIGSLKASLSGTSAGPLGRPVSTLSFAITHYFFGSDPFAFKAINLAIHLINGLLVSWLASLLLLTLRGINISNSAKRWLPLWVSAAWLMHPINFVAIMMAVQRMTLLATMFTLLALTFHLKAMHCSGHRKKWWWLACAWLIFLPLAVLSKETGLLFPLYVLSIAIFTDKHLLLSEKTKRWVAPATLSVIALTGLGMLWHMGWGWLDAGYAMRPFTLLERMMTEARVLWFYVAQILIPNYGSFALYLDNFPLSTGLLTPLSTLVAILALGISITAAFISRYRAPVLGFAVAWFLIGQSLESSFIPLEIAHEHRNYLPSFGLIFGFAYLGAILLGRIKMDNPKLITTAAAGIPIALLALFTWLRAEQLANPLIGAQIEATRHPESARANHEAARALIKAGYGDTGDPIGAQSIRFYLEQSEKVDPTFKFGYLSLIVWACASNRPVETQWLGAMTSQLEHAPFAPKDRALPGMLLKPLVSMSKCLKRQDVLRLFEAGAKNPRISLYVRSRFLEAASDYELLVSHDTGSAISYLKRAASIWPYDVRLNSKLKSYPSNSEG
jgi:hypothetical protein